MVSGRASPESPPVRVSGDTPDLHQNLVPIALLRPLRECRGPLEGNVRSHEGRDRPKMWVPPKICVLYRNLIPDQSPPTGDIPTTRTKVLGSEILFAILPKECRGPLLRWLNGVCGGSFKGSSSVGRFRLACVGTHGPGRHTCSPECARGSGSGWTEVQVPGVRSGVKRDFTSRLRNGKASCSQDRG